MASGLVSLGFQYLTVLAGRAWRDGGKPVVYILILPVNRLFAIQHKFKTITLVYCSTRSLIYQVIKTRMRLFRSEYTKYRFDTETLQSRKFQSLTFDKLKLRCKSECRDHDTLISWVHLLFLVTPTLSSLSFSSTQAVEANMIPISSENICTIVWVNQWCALI